MTYDLAEMGYGIDVDAFDKRGLGRVGLRHKEAAVARPLGHDGHRQDTIDVAHAAVQAQFAHDQSVIRSGRRLSCCRHNAERDRQIVSRPFLAQVGGSQVDRQPLLGKDKAAVGDRRAHAFAALAYGRARQSDNGQPLQTAGNVHLHLDLFRIQPDNRATPYLRQHQFLPAPSSCSPSSRRRLPSPWNEGPRLCRALLLNPLPPSSLSPSARS